MRFVHISDTHIGPTPDFANYGHNSLRNLEHLIDHLNVLAETESYDFVLHSGDVVEDRSEAAYRLAAAALARLKKPVYYAAGNHDDPTLMSRILLGRELQGTRFDYQFDCDGIQCAVFDSRGTDDPTGHLEPAQIEALRQLCTPEGRPLVIIVHHQPVYLDAEWLDNGTSWFPHMRIDNGASFMAAVGPARARLRGVFFGHIHRAYQTLRNGVLLVSAPSTFGQLQTYPSQNRPYASPDEPAGYNLVTVTADQTIVRQHYLARP